ncbi:xanthine dehydrogenase family protein subunit M [Amylibacter sp. IMCC11727]|uniref:FAD binding domain-containing protein n=1 Tax=Amylibacter sp. IMCC11727 TaxID=3039851 RepID=UPI00244E5B29|nr:xanthine dehydrogenase family protein subunit M [Amylibacter sp. IMCC11727]WGI20360.1 xanthine dehydrogenase family protein subunit M [Amylibacter sp. IMCC11727]
MYDTNYHRADTVLSATSKLVSAEDGKYLAGGQTLIPTMKQRLAAPSDLVDVSGVEEMRGIAVRGNTITIGASCTHAEVASSAEVTGLIPALAALAGGIGDPAVRARGTIGGSIANNDPAADYPAACLGLGATIITDKREIAADDFFVGMFETALDENEIITSVNFPAPTKAAYAKFPNPASRYAMVGVMAAQAADGVRVAVTGAGSDGVFRHADMEAALGSDWSAAAAEGVATDPGNMMADIHGSSEYRAHLVGVMAGRAVDNS